MDSPRQDLLWRLQDGVSFRRVWVRLPDDGASGGVSGHALAYAKAGRYTGARYSVILFANLCKLLTFAEFRLQYTCLASSGSMQGAKGMGLNRASVSLRSSYPTNDLVVPREAVGRAVSGSLAALDLAVIFRNRTE